jgi:hypothetical protein
MPWLIEKNWQRTHQRGGWPLSPYQKDTLRSLAILKKYKAVNPMRDTSAG